MLVGTFLAAIIAMASTTVSAAPISAAKNLTVPLIEPRHDSVTHGKGINNEKHGPEGYKFGNFCNPDLKDCPKGKACADVNHGGVPDFKCMEVS